MLAFQFHLKDLIINFASNKLFHFCVTWISHIRSSTLGSVQIHELLMNVLILGDLGSYQYAAATLFVKIDHTLIVFQFSLQIVFKSHSFCNCTDVNESFIHHIF